MGRGSSGTVGRYGGGGNFGIGDVLSTELMTWSGQRTDAESDFFKVGEELAKEYGNNGIPQNFFQIATLKPKAQGVIAYYDGSNVAINERFMDKAVLETAYDDCVKNGFHPSKGNRTAAEAVAAHELGHRLTDAAGAKLGVYGIDAIANKIVAEARKQTKHRGVVQMAAKISRYATQSNAETIAEAFSDVFCNGNKARAESKAVVNVLNKYAK